MEKKVIKSKISALEIVLRIFLGFLIPFILINGIILFLIIQMPKIHIIDNTNENYDKSKIRWTIDCLLPITNVEAYYNDTTIPYSIFDNFYSIDITENGTYQIKATALNKGTVTSYIDVENVDAEPPVIDFESAIATATTLTFKIYDNQTGINYENVYAIKSNGDKIKPSYIDQESGMIQFSFDPNIKLTVHIEDNGGNITETSFGASN